MRIYTHIDMYTHTYIGDILLLDLNFSAPVLVHGVPTLTVNTGCYNNACTIAERQSFVCRADVGQFGLTFLNQSIMNIDATTTMQAFKLLLQRLPGIHDVHVKYSEADSRDYSGGDTVCTSIGKNVTMTFLNVTFPNTNGDVPNLTFDITNGFFTPDLRTGLSLGNLLNPLAGINTNYLPSLIANEIQKGFKRRDGTAFYHSGSGTKTLSFRYLYLLYCLS
jgi:hypothetical protein